MDKIQKLKDEYVSETNVNKKKELHTTISNHITIIERQLVQMQKQMMTLKKEMDSLWEQRVKLGNIIEVHDSVKTQNEIKKDVDVKNKHLHDTPPTLCDEQIISNFSEIYMIINIPIPKKWLKSYTINQVTVSRGSQQNNNAIYKIDLGSIPINDMIIKNNACESVKLHINNGIDVVLTMKLDPILNMETTITMDRGTMINGILKDVRTL